jgi:hypothetical protein
MVSPFNRLKGFEHWAIPSRQQSLGNLQPVVWINADEMRVERRMMNLGKAECRSGLWVGRAFRVVGYDVCGVEQQGLGQAR